MNKTTTLRNIAASAVALVALLAIILSAIALKAVKAAAVIAPGILVGVWLTDSHESLVVYLLCFILLQQVMFHMTNLVGLNGLKKKVDA